MTGPRAAASQELTIPDGRDLGDETPPRAGY